tara:strand:+ start:14659 stop:14886 length:228 start_codon:yes stop_codon:yes gene_type:complete
MTTPAPTSIPAFDQQDAYLGDGVYASFDGFQVWLAVNHHENKQVALEPQVLKALLSYAERVYGCSITVAKDGSHD